MPELSGLAWAILEWVDGRNRLGGALDFEKAAAGPRDALIAAGAVDKRLAKPASKPSFRHKARPAVYGLYITDLGRKLLADHKGQAPGAESS